MPSEREIIMSKYKCLTCPNFKFEEQESCKNCALRAYIRQIQNRVTRFENMLFEHLTCCGECGGHGTDGEKICERCIGTGKSNR